MSNNEWYTPESYLDLVREVLGEIDLDPFSCEQANQVVRAKRIFTKERSAFDYQWPRGNIFMNPPYSRDLINKSVEILIDNFYQFTLQEAIVLVNSSTSAKWYQQLILECSALCLPNHRIKFIDADGKPGNNPAHSQTFFYLGQNPKKFITIFNRVGVCLEGQLYDH